MKVTSDDYTLINNAMKAIMVKYKIESISSTKIAWDIFHEAWRTKLFDGVRLYNLYDDSHLETAFKKMMVSNNS